MGRSDKLHFVKSEPMETTELPAGEPFPMPEMDSNGVDLSQIRNHLKLTPLERLRTLESAVASIIKIRRAIRKAPISRNSHPAR
jgi:hypothetical protein